MRISTEKANIPELEGLATLSSPRFNRNSKPKPDNEKGTSLSTSAKGGVNGKSDPTSSSKSKNPGPNGSTKCLFCGAKHKLDDCTNFCRKPFSERRDFFRKRLCMGCAASKGHQVAHCKERLKCKIKTCSGTHPTCLHKELTQDNAAISNCMSVCLIPEQSGGFDHTIIVGQASGRA